MCGIYGIFTKQALTESIKKSSLDKTLSLIHRGPDNQEIMEYPYGYHGHARLSILDTSERSNQPMVYNNHILCFNGEIWNYKELKIQLKNKGYSFKTTSDTEVLLLYLYENGISEKSLNKINGMFSFAFSNPEGKTFLVRDRFGIIPLYYTINTGLFGNKIEWSSERKVLMDNISEIYALPPGNIFDLNSKKLSVWYHGIKYDNKIKDIDLLKLLETSVKERMMSDVPLCCLISGGIDSSIILYYAKKFNKNIVAYTAKTKESTEDLKWSRTICKELNIPLQEVMIDININLYRESLKRIEISSKAQIEIGALCLPLAQAIKADGFKICLSGEGADELLGGYGNIIIKGYKADDIEYHEIKKYFLNKMARGNFVRCNKIFMSHSIECRLPFLSFPLVETLTNCKKSENPTNKILLKKAVEGILPKDLIYRKKETFQGGCKSNIFIKEKINTSPIKYYNQLAKKIFNCIPKE